jgi:hypothetical protein
MRRMGPYVTLSAGLAVAAVLIVLSTTASRKADSAAATAAGAADVAPAAAATTAPPPPTEAPPVVETSPPPPPPTSKAPVRNVQATYAGKVVGGGATIAISIKNGVAIAYLCDGKRTEAWLQGTAVDGKLELSNGKGATLVGTYANGVATGTLTAGGQQWTFSVRVVTAPSGLYRASANVRNARVVGGWICVQGQGCVGTYTIDGENTSPGPALDQATGTAVIEGTTVRAELQ